MKRNHKLLLAIAVIAAVLLFAAMQWIGPYRTLRAIDRYAAAGDTEALQNVVDFDLLERNMQRRLMGHMAMDMQQRTGRRADDPSVQQLSSMLATQTAAKLITPTGLIVLLQGDALSNGDHRRTEIDANAKDHRLSNGKGRFESSRKFGVWVRNTNDQDVVFVLERNGLRWKLTDIVLPEKTR